MALITQSEFARLKRKRDSKGRIFYAFCLAAVLISLTMLGVLLSKIGLDGYSRVNWSFLTSYASRHPELSGILAPLVGSIYVVGIAGVTSFVLGVGAAVYLEEYAHRSRFAQAARINIANLAGVPSVVYGLLGLEIFVRAMGLHRSVLAGGLTLALLVLPLIIVASGEAIRAVPSSLREGGFGLGATRWQVVRHLVLPQAFPGILTGVILAVSRATGETAPLIFIGGLTYVAFVPDSPLSGFTAMPVQIFNWISRPQEGFHEAAAAGIIVLLVVLLLMNALAVFLRNKFSNRLEG